MTRLLVHVEGETEETFVNEVLSDHLVRVGFSSVSARLLGNARLRQRRGGVRGWSGVRKDILGHLREDLGCFATTMVDYYGLPRDGDGAWPGRATASTLPFNEKGLCVEDALSADVAGEMGGAPEAGRFVAFVTMHEFEGLLFSDCEAFGRGIGRPELAKRFQEVRDQFATPEEINDSPITAPSKRVQSIFPGYEKPLLGTLAIIEIGLDRIRAECPRFHRWVSHLENLVRP